MFINQANTAQQWLLSFGLLAASQFITGCSSTAGDPTGVLAEDTPIVFEWQSELQKNHRLAGLIYDVKSKQIVRQKQVFEQILQANYLILGEKHDNPDHHRFQLELVKLLEQQNQLAQLSFEMISPNQQANMDDNLGTNLDEPTLKIKLRWPDTSWKWEFYGPMIHYALTRNIPVFSANLERSEIKDIYSLKFGVPVPPKPIKPKLEQRVQASHCGMLPESQYPAMVRVQIARDQRMTESLVQRPNNQGVKVLISGNYHARRDVGVPLYLQEREPQAKVVSISFMEVERGSILPSRYLDTELTDAPYDYVWFTPRLNNKDYCEDMREKFRNSVKPELKKDESGEHAI